MKDSAHLPLSSKLILDSCLVDWTLSDVQGGREVSGIWLSGRRFVHSSTETREHLTYTGFCNSRVEIIGYDDHIPDIYRAHKLIIVRTYFLRAVTTERKQHSDTLRLHLHATRAVIVLFCRKVKCTKNSNPPGIPCHNPVP